MPFKRGSAIRKQFHNLGTITFSINLFSVVCVWAFTVDLVKLQLQLERGGALQSSCFSEV